MRVLVTGASGQVGSEVCAALEKKERSRRHGRAIEVLAASHHDIDVADRDAVLGLFFSFEPDIVIHTGAFTNVDACESEVEKAFSVNALGTRHVAEGARRVGAHLLYVSTDYVFDGTSARPYLEWDEPHPLSVYGASKLGGERELDATQTIVRTSWVCGRHGNNMVKTVLRLLESSDAPLRFVADQHGSPTIAHDLARCLIDLAVSRRPGIFHVTNQGITTWFGFAQLITEAAGHDPERIEPITTDELNPPRPAPRPRNSALANTALGASGLGLLPSWQESTSALVAELLQQV